MRRAAVLAALLFLPAAAAPGVEPGFERSETRRDCANRDPLRQPFFGDLHVHTTFSFDAWGQGTRNTPRDAYRFARGEAVGIQPYAEDGSPRRTLRLDRPLDFAMVSDHAEMLGETDLCRSPGAPGYDRFVCVLLRRWPALGYMIVNSQWTRSGARRPDLCGEDGGACREAARGPWQAIQGAAEEFYDRSEACRLTTFVGYEWSGSRIGMIHRNVVFRNERVPALPASAIEHENDERRLWEWLDRHCRRAGTGCDALAIPHNPNLSMGEMFATRGPDGAELGAEQASRRAAFETLVEITQHKGDSECRPGRGEELCEFETLPEGDLEGLANPWAFTPLPDSGVFVREALLDGLAQEQRIGVNPFKLGIVGSTDTHLGTPGLVSERGFPGHAAGTVSARLEVPPLADQVEFNPGGLAVLWAEENSRDALFEAMRRREAYGTSGPRLRVRFFGGWDYPEDLCDSRDLVARGYAEGVPMGGDLPPVAGAGRAPVFAVSALRDPGSASQPGTRLGRIQIVKGWTEGGRPRERVFDLALAGDPEAQPDLATCEPPAGGADALCRVWRDPGFDPDAPAFYYARVVESPSCRWSWRACLAASVRCDGLVVPRGPLAACCDEAVPKTIEERAWTSPIWYTPRPS